MAEPFLHARGAPAAAGLEAPHHDRPADLGARDHQPIDVELMVVLGIGDRAFQRLLYLLGDTALAEGERRDRLRGRRLRIIAATRLSLRGLTRMLRRMACASVSASARGCLGLLMSAPLRLLVAGVAGEGAGRREFAELVADHVLVHLHRQELVAVIDAEGQADELRQDGRAARPDADDLVAAGCRAVSALFSRYPSTNGPFQTERAISYLPLLRRRMIRLSVRLLARVL